MLRVAVIGTNFGRRVLLPALQRTRRCEVLGVVSPRNDNANPQMSLPLHFAEEADVFSTWEEAADSPDVDALAIAVPPALQPKIAYRALTNNKHLFLEKPLAESLETARLLRIACNTADTCIVGVDFEFPQIHEFVKARELVTAGRIGGITRVSVFWQVVTGTTRAASEGMSSWKHTHTQGGGVLNLLGTHVFNYVEQFCGPIKTLSAFIAKRPPGELYATLSGSLHCEGEYVIKLDASSKKLRHPTHTIVINGTYGALVLESTSVGYVAGWRLRQYLRGAPRQEVPCADVGVDEEQNDARIVPVSRLMHKWLDAIHTRRNSCPGVNEAYRAQILVDAALRSDSSNGAQVGV